MTALRNLHVKSLNPLVPPAILIEDLPASDKVATTVFEGRSRVRDVLSHKSDRFLVIVGPCSIHDPVAAMDYAKRLAATAERLKDDLVIVMRVYFEKPRTTVGWKGLINDPNLDDSFRINAGLRLARRLLLDINELGLPCATEFLDLITPQFLSELIAWGAIGARTTESQTHRELASGLSAPIGFKNGTAGDVKIAVDAVLSSSRPHSFVGVTEQGLAAIVHTTGNPHCHVILRGGASGPNYDADSVRAAGEAMIAAGATPAVMVDCSHGNSSKDFKRQPLVAEALAQQIERGPSHLVGAMLESHLVEGNQQLKDPKTLTYGQSITDACINWDATLPILERWAQAVRTRRNQR
ncbi:MAG TPA: 3-deoxy-7-phosphoheptulonate synthase [Polyangiaceae bacterium]|jgi:3-deoxy-7-phosphoheptulonate synthase|nr:3-deoxy-7-phosphoheptulonate synthase [Polyangiaceae bacterium]